MESALIADALNVLSLHCARDDEVHQGPDNSLHPYRGSPGTRKSSLKQLYINPATSDAAVHI